LVSRFLKTKARKDIIIQGAKAKIRFSGLNIKKDVIITGTNTVKAQKRNRSLLENSRTCPTRSIPTKKTNNNNIFEAITDKCNKVGISIIPSEWKTLKGILHMPTKA